MQVDRAYTWTMVRQQTEAATEVNALRSLHQHMKTAAQRWRERGMPAAEISQAINGWHDLLMQRVIELNVAALEREGIGAPPCAFCWLLLGSGGRREQTLHLDQDNALLHADVPPAKQAQTKAYFQQLAARVVTQLAEVGYPYCQGYVMASNARWNLSWSECQALIRSYVELPNWDNARFLMIAADLRPLYGDAGLAQRFAGWLGELLQTKAFLHWQVADHGKEQEIGLDALQRFRVDRWGEHEGELNIKERGYLQIVNAVRLWSLANGAGVLAATGSETAATRERITRLHAAEIWDAKWAGAVRSAFDLFSRHRLWSNYVCPDRLPASEKAALKQALQTARQLQKHTAKHFRKPR